MNEDGSVDIAIEEVVRELVGSPLGQALWEAAQGRVVMRKQSELIASLRDQLGGNG